MSTLPSVYLAGPEVFLPDARAAGERLKAVCREAGLEAHFPLDAELPEGKPRTPELGRAIAVANEGLIRRCDGVLANLTPFRGPSADPGTVYEVGYARALGKMIVGYTQADRTFIDRTSAWLHRLDGSVKQRADGTLEDGDRMALEDFGLIDNLMIPAGIIDGGGAIVTPQDATASNQSVFALAAQRLAALLRDRRPGYRLRKATLDDQASLQALIGRSARTLGARDYTSEQIEAALRGAFGVDTQLIVDGTYFVAEEGPRLVGCGGWSMRRTLFGGDSGTQRDETRLDPRVDAARIRAFFVDPDRARHGIASALLERCEADAVAHGFARLQLMATLPGVRFYSALGYSSEAAIEHALAPGLSIAFVPMTRVIESSPRR